MSVVRRPLSLVFAPHSKVARSGFTLIECMFAMLLIAMVLPAVDLGITAAAHAGDQARHRTEAAGLAQSKISELVLSAQTQQLQSGSGDFGDVAPGYKWSSNVQEWAGNSQSTGSAQEAVMQQLDVTVTWSTKDSLTVSALIYVRPEPTS